MVRISREREGKQTARGRTQMSTNPPGTKTEYSRGHLGSRGVGRDFAASPAGSAGALILAGAALGALLLLVAEFTPLYELRTQNGALPTRSFAGGAHHAYALVPIALLACGLAYGVWRTGSRPALLAIGVLGLVALLLAVLVDLPDAHARGVLSLSGGRLVNGYSTPTTGFYLETLGAMVLLVTCVCGFLALGPPGRSAPASPSRRD